MSDELVAPAVPQSSGRCPRARRVVAKKMGVTASSRAPQRWRGGAGGAAVIPATSVELAALELAVEWKRERCSMVRLGVGWRRKGVSGSGAAYPCRTRRNGGGGPTNSGEQNAQPGGTVQGEKRGESERRARAFKGEVRGSG